jgi:hypothetical protein
MRRRFFEMNGDHIGASLFVYRAFKNMRRMVRSRVKFERSYPNCHRTARTRGHGDRPGIDRRACRRSSRDDHPCSRGAKQIAPAEGWAL